MLMLGSRCFGHHYAHHQELRTEGCYNLRSGHSSILPALNFQPAAPREPDSLCGNQRYRRELLMMGVMVPETC